MHEDSRDADTRLVRRASELARIAEFWSGASGVLCLVGDAGIGKTALWRLAVQDAARTGHTVLDASPAEAERDMPYAVLADPAHRGCSRNPTSASRHRSARPSR